MKTVLGITQTDLSYACVPLHIPELRNLVLRINTLTERVMELLNEWEHCERTMLPTSPAYSCNLIYISELRTDVSAFLIELRIAE